MLGYVLVAFIGWSMFSEKRYFEIWRLIPAFKKKTYRSVLLQLSLHFLLKCHLPKFYSFGRLYLIWLERFGKETFVFSHVPLLKLLREFFWKY